MMKVFDQDQLELIREALERVCRENGHVRVTVDSHELEVVSRGFFKLTGDPEPFPILPGRAVVVVIGPDREIVFSDYLRPCETQTLLARLQTPVAWSVKISEWSERRFEPSANGNEPELAGRNGNVRAL